MKKLLYLLLLFTPLAHAQLWTGQLGASRGTDWTQAGIPGYSRTGALPSDSWTQCGATIAPFGSSGTPAAPTVIINALNHTGTGYTGCASNTYVLLGSGDFYLSAGVRNRGVSGTELRGQGSATKLHFYNTTTCSGGASSCVVSFEDSVGEYPSGVGTAAKWTAGYAKGATSITVSSASALNITANQTMLVLDQDDTGYTGNTTAAGGSGVTGSAVDNGGYFNCGDAYNPTANSVGTITVSGGVNVTGSGFSASYGGTILINSIAYIVSSFNSSTSLTLSSLTPAPNGSATAYFPTGCSYNGSDGSAARAHRYQEETVIVTGCSPSCSNSGSTVLTITPGLIHPNWALAQSPEVWAIQGSSNVGLRDFVIDASNTTGGQYGVNFTDVSNFWARGLTVLNTYSQGISAYNVTLGEITSNYVYNAGQSVNGTDPNTRDPSGIDISGSSVLVANNVIQGSRIGIIQNGPGSGNVIAYNYMTNCFESNGDLWGCIWDGHSNGADFNLFEGNVAPQVYQDQTHGVKLAETYYRNFLPGWESCSNGNCSPSATQKNANLYGIGVLSGNRYGNFIGNVIGTPGVTTNGYAYDNASQFFSTTTGYAWNIGSGNGSVGVGGPIPIDPIIFTTVMWWDNYDTYNGATLACTGAATPVAACPIDQRAASAPTYPGLSFPSATLPASFYFASRPSWWSASIPFPAIGPDVTSGNVGQVAGTLNVSGHQSGTAAINGTSYAGNSTSTAWAGHINAIPAMTCFLSTMSGLPDGTGSASTFNDSSCYSAASLISTTTTLTAASTTPVTGASDLLTATLSQSAATGTVTFYDGGSPIGTGTVSSGIATFNVIAITAGTHSYTATYGGDISYASSTSSPLSVTATSIMIPTAPIPRGVALQ